MQTLPCSLGRWIARFLTLERGKPRLSALKRRGDCAFCLPNRVRECNLPCSLGR
ncbi:hypothetical protein T4D_14146 [Trichinella pseudospiralis]|uniref:Uncharacterized protein n=1 Tax=Trichinella pseudospiralis TaxID=6337 RepID=A0A0V1DL12_TRIPS|nr:hypothetical protein T4D_14146 [Trichinella pseudospiralis]